MTTFFIVLSFCREAVVQAKKEREGDGGETSKRETREERRRRRREERSAESHFHFRLDFRPVRLSPFRLHALTSPLGYVRVSRPRVTELSLVTSRVHPRPVDFVASQILAPLV